MSDDIVKRAAALVEKQKAWDAWEYPSQPAPPAVVEGEVATLVSDMAAEITRLRAELATARREGMEEAAKIAAGRRVLANQAQALREGAHDKKGAAEAAIEAHEAAEIAAAIRAAAGEAK